MRTPFKLFRENEKNTSFAPVIPITQRYGQHIFINNDGQIYNHLEPLRQNRFLLHFPEYFNIPNTLVKSVNRPRCTFEPSNINGFNIMNPRWDDIKVTFFDTVNPSIQRALYDIIDNQNINNSQMIFKLESLDPLGTVVNEWEINGFISEMNFGDLDYSSDLMTEVSLTITVNSCFLKY